MGTISFLIKEEEYSIIAEVVMIMNQSFLFGKSHVDRGASELINYIHVGLSNCLMIGSQFHS